MTVPYSLFLKHIEDIKQQGLYKSERLILSPQNSSVKVGGRNVINMCANNYLGLSSHPDVIMAAKNTLDSHGFGMSSVRFICGTQDIHVELENKISTFLHKEDTILYAAAFDANGGLFEPLLGPEDAIISDELNHASIIDGIRLCKAQRFRFKNSDMADLESKLKKCDQSRIKLIVTDGVFSMDGTIAKLDVICELASKYNALVMVDDCHATGFVGPTGRGSAEYHNVLDKVDIVTGTLGKALGGAMGGFTSAKKNIIDLLRQRSRPYLFSNSLAPSIVGASLKALSIISQSNILIEKLNQNTSYFRKEINNLGFDIISGTHPIVPIMLYDAHLAQEFSKKLLERGVYVVGFFYPVVPKKLARIRVQISAAHTRDQLDFALKAFFEVGKELGTI
tara:strand:- start:409 stop:1590 length:1182 start_codon:yes stop_codon:yes gene_type:complete